MIIKISFLNVLFALISTLVFSQNIKPFEEVGEAYFKFTIEELDNIQQISNLISIDKIMDNEIYAYCNEFQYKVFSELGYNIEFLARPSTLIKNPRMLDHVNIKDIQDWDFYPTYQAYLDMMNQFAADYPDLCQVFSIGQSIEGRELMFVRISQNVGIEEGKAKVMYTATMHGDEVTGYPLTLRFINYLLENYGSDDRITQMLNTLDIFINPLANPDGTFAGGNNTVYGATRGNANFIDLNRNYPDIDEGPHPDGNSWQVETEAFMQLAEDYNFMLSANYHGGQEVFNYPWDTWYQRHADDDWWYFVGREFADTIHEYAPNGYFSFMLDGVTNGYDWYSISGGRQDFMNGFYNCREVTLEISNVKTPPASELPDFWEYLYRSMMNYFEQAYYGFQGTITDAVTGEGIKAKIYLEEHDDEYSFVFSDTLTGTYYRPVYEGTYDVTISAECYESVSFTDINIENYETIILDVELEQLGFEADETTIVEGDEVDFTELSCGFNPVSWAWAFEGGTPSSSTEPNPSIVYNTAGVYDVSLTISDGTNNYVYNKSDYITVMDTYIMDNATVTTCGGNFYDSGGPDNDYGTEEDYTMTFYPGEANKAITCNFSYFNVEYHPSCTYDYLEVYDGSNDQYPLIGTFCGTETPDLISATNPEGALTFVFHSDNSTQENGWIAEITCDIMSDTDNMVTQEVHIKPNPAKNIIQIETPYIINEAEIISISGKLLMHETYGLHRKMDMDISLIPEGIYLLKVSTDNGVLVSKLLVK